METRGNRLWIEAKVHAAFTRNDLFVTVGIISLLGILVLAGIMVAGEKRRIFVCTSHLKNLGHGFANYTYDHQDALPPAVVLDGTNSTSWDREIAAYLDGKWDKRKSPEQQKEVAAKIAPVFKCPSDREPRGDANVRSYSVPMYDVSRAGWPPKVDSVGGLGLYLDAKIVASLRANEAKDPVDSLPGIKTSLAGAPADTSLLVERISILNALWATRFACTEASENQFDAKTFTAKEFHRGKLNYLMLDGHVEMMSPEQSRGIAGGVWTLRKGD